MDFTGYENDVFGDIHQLPGPKRNINRLLGYQLPSMNIADSFDLFSSSYFHGSASASSSNEDGSSVFNSSPTNANKEFSMDVDLQPKLSFSHHSSSSLSSFKPIPPYTPIQLPASPASSGSGNKCVTCVLDAPTVAHCAQCQGFLCKSCFQCHRNMVMFSNHTVVDIRSNGTCQYHLTLPLNQYCLTCSEMMCHECLKTHMGKNCSTCAIRTMQVTCTEIFQNLSLRLQSEIESSKKERLNVEELQPKVEEWMERAKLSLANMKQSFVADVLEKVFKECEETIEKQGASIELMKEVYETRMLKGEMLLKGLCTDLTGPHSLAKAYSESSSFTQKVDSFLQQKPILPSLPDVDEDFPPPSPNLVAKTIAQSTNYSFCMDLLKHEPCSPVSDGSFRDFTPMKMKLNYDVNFGSFGVEDGQFSEPAGICVTSEGYIAVTDTKNHRIQVFDEIGCLKLAFGVSGTNPGQILYPNCIAACPRTDNFVITERTPVHQVQVYSSSGKYIRRFGQNLIQFPRGVTVDKAGNIIVVECKVMRVTIFDQLGTVLRTFCAPAVMSFPMDVCCNDNHEIFVVDNRRHCVHVFDYNGNPLRTMCGSGSISFPISVSINDVGELLVTDNHQSFNMTFFTQQGVLVRAYESRNRHLQCLAATVQGVDKVFLATKDFRVYMYDCSKGK